MKLVYYYSSSSKSKKKLYYMFEKDSCVYTIDRDRMMSKIK